MTNLINKLIKKCPKCGGCNIISQKERKQIKCEDCNSHLEVFIKKPRQNLFALVICGLCILLVSSNFISLGLGFITIDLFRHFQFYVYVIIIPVTIAGFVMHQTSRAYRSI